MTDPWSHFRAAPEEAVIVCAVDARRADQFAWQDWVIGADFTTDTLYRTSWRLLPVYVGRPGFFGTPGL